MILPDANLLLYAIDEHSPHHRPARDWLQAALVGTTTLGLPWISLLAFLRLSTLPGVFVSPLSASQALESVDSWLRQPSTQIVHPGPRHQELLRELLLVVGTAGNLVTDAHLAALAIENGAELATNDRDFGRFPRLRVSYPLSDG